MRSKRVRSKRVRGMRSAATAHSQSKAFANLLFVCYSQGARVRWHDPILKDYRSGLARNVARMPSGMIVYNGDPNSNPGPSPPRPGGRGGEWGGAEG